MTLFGSSDRRATTTIPGARSTPVIDNRRVPSFAFGMTLIMVLALQFTGCATTSLHSGALRQRFVSFEAAAARNPELSEVASTFDRLVTPAPGPHERTRELNLFAEVVELARSDYVESVEVAKLAKSAISGMERAVATDGGDKSAGGAPTASGYQGDDGGAQAAALPATNSARANHLGTAPLIEAALVGMLHDLDAHSDYMSPESYREMQVRTRGEFGGIGIEVTMENGLIKVVSPIDDTPAHAAGLKAGDLVTHIDARPVLGLTLPEAVEAMRGPVGSKVTVTIRRVSVEKPFDIVVTRDIVRIRSVRWHLEGDIGYLRVTTFNERTSEGVHHAVAKMRETLGDALAGLIIDLRNNPGGLLDQALSVSDAFLDDGEIVSTRGRQQGEIRRFTADSEDILGDLPIAVLINSGSASAAEIVAGALQDQGRALVIGARSFGKGSVQTIMPVSGGGAVRLTTARYYTPAGRSIQLTGIQPDIIAPIEEGEQASREADLDNVLPAEGELGEVAAARLEERCPGAVGLEDVVLACAKQIVSENHAVTAQKSH